MKIKRFVIRVRLEVDAKTVEQAKLEVEAGLSESGLVWAYSDIDEG